MEANKQCPYCGETIKAEAKKCRHCGEWLTSVPISNTAHVSEEPDSHSEKGQIIEKDYWGYSMACLVMIFIAILSGLKDLPVHGSGFISSIAAWIPKWLLTLCEGVLTVYIAWGLGLLCREKGLKNEWIFPFWIGLSIISCLFAIWDPEDINAILGLFFLLLAGFLAIIQITVGVIVISKVSILVGTMLIVNTVVDISASIVCDGEGDVLLLVSTLTICLIDIFFYRALEHAFDRASTKAQ